MAILHTVNKSPFERNTLEACLGRSKKGSGVLLIEDGVYAAMNGQAFCDKISAVAAEVNFYVLGPDLAARGLDSGEVMDGIEVVDYSGFVDLTIKYDQVSAW